jgi:hypothetical protein
MLDSNEPLTAAKLAAHHIREASQIGQDRSRAILPIQPQQDQLLWQVIGFNVELYGSHGPAQFFPELPVTRVGERAEPLRGMRLSEGRAGRDDLPRFRPV